MEMRTLQTQRDSPFRYGWKIRVAWLTGAISGPFSEKAKNKCQDWATKQAYRLGRSDYGVHFNTPRFSKNQKLANAYDDGAYDVWLTHIHVEEWFDHLM